MRSGWIISAFTRTEHAHEQAGARPAFRLGLENKQNRFYIFTFLEVLIPMHEEENPPFLLRALWWLTKLSGAGLFGFLAFGASIKSIPPGEHGFGGVGHLIIAMIIFAVVALFSLFILHLLGNSLSNQSRLVFSLIALPIFVVSGLFKAVAILWVLAFIVIGIPLLRYRQW